MKKDYVTLFNERKWKDAFEAMPLSAQKAVKVSPGDVQTIRVRASEFNKESETRRISVSVDYDESTVMIRAYRKS